MKIHNPSVVWFVLCVHFLQSDWKCQWLLQYTCITRESCLQVSCSLVLNPIRSCWQERKATCQILQLGLHMCSAVYAFLRHFQVQTWPGTFWQATVSSSQWYPTEQMSIRLGGEMGTLYNLSIATIKKQSQQGYWIKIQIQSKILVLFVAFLELRSELHICAILNITANLPLISQSHSYISVFSLPLHIAIHPFLPQSPYPQPCSRAPFTLLPYMVHTA